MLLRVPEDVEVADVEQVVRTRGVADDRLLPPSRRRRARTYPRSGALDPASRPRSLELASPARGTGVRRRQRVSAALLDHGHGRPQHIQGVRVHGGRLPVGIVDVVVGAGGAQTPVPGAKRTRTVSRSSGPVCGPAPASSASWTRAANSRSVNVRRAPPGRQTRPPRAARGSW